MLEKIIGIQKHAGKVRKVILIILKRFTSQFFSQRFFVEEDFCMSETILWISLRAILDWMQPGL